MARVRAKFPDLMFRSKNRNNPARQVEEPMSPDSLVIIDRAVDPYVVMFHDPQGYRAEQLRMLRNKLVALNPDGAPKTLVVTSAISGEGKTITSINLAMAFAEMERHRVVLVDADLRRPSVEQTLGLETQIGFSDLMLGKATLDQVLRTMGDGRAKLIGAGSPALPAEVLDRRRLMELYDRLKERFDYVVIDTPPVLPATDAGVLASGADGTMVVVRLEHSHKRHTKEAITSLGELGSNVLGTFITEVRGRDPEADARLGYNYRRTL